ncbi:hypothetical protein A9485_08505 [Bacillus cereus]|uniref:HEPN domain-containing protein n=1 Tax=Bacillus cereus TaxID=1396 RepID=UPI0008FE71A4|nr:HEPN domain-containing protein [Bacillus cereus]OJD90265.1 hypothetical protein A9485_08505 [Bacillus cereus]
MSIIIAGSVRSFVSESKSVHFEFDSGKAISNNKNFLEENFLNESFISCIGIIEANSFFNSSYIYSNFSLDENEEYSRSDLDNILEHVWGPLHVFQLSLWFVKDNNVNVEQLYLYDLKTELVVKSKRNVWASNARGRYEDSRFTIEELKNALEWKEKILKYLELDEMPEAEVHNSSGVRYRNRSAQTPYAELNRVSRALRFIMVGRYESFLPMKISAYVGALEALFSTTKSEVTHQVAERAVKMLGGDIETRLSNYTLIKNVYDIRSMYVHGSEIKEKALNKAVDLMKDFDELIRNVLKVIIEKYPNLSEMKLNELDLFFKKLILQ